MKTKLHYIYLMVVLFMSLAVSGQDAYWNKINNITNQGHKNVSDLHLEIQKVDFFNLNTDAFVQSTNAAALKGSPNTVVITLPSYNGKVESFKIYQNQVFAPSLAAKYPNIKSFIGVSVDNAGTQLRMSVSPQGVQTMITSLNNEVLFMMPVSHASNQYIVYAKSARENYVDKFECSTVENLQAKYSSKMSLTSRDANDQLLRTYRLAVSVNGEYTQYHGGTVAGALAAINATMTRVNAVFETDMAINFQVVDANQLIFTNAGTDPYSASLGNWNGELQTTLNNTIGDAAYDIGHMFGASGGGGNAGCIGCVCEDGSKGSGITSPANGIPQGDNFDIDYVAHEIGHQMGANHTFAWNTEGAGVNAEPGSGTTIMGYAGITGGNDVQQHSDPYFHYHSINQILNNVATAPNDCAATTAITNNPPVASAGGDFVIPQGTAYVLKGSATDADGGDALMYCWEQTDSALVTSASFGPTQASGSMNRSLSPTTESDRYIPNWNRVVAGQLTETNPTIGSDWETVATVGRTLNWALTVRDREPTATGLSGQSSFDLTQITVEDVAAFTVNTPPTWGQGSAQSATWTVGSTANGTINCQTVNILFSEDGGLTFPTTLVANTPNDGTETIIVPTIADISNARILVEAADNIFYAMSEDFSVSNSPDFAMSTPNGDQYGGCGSDTLSYDFDFIVVNGFAETTVFSATGLPAGVTAVFTPASLSVDGAFTMALTGLTAAADGDYTITVTGTSTSVTKNLDASLSIANALCASVGTTTYETSTTLVQFNAINQVSDKPSGYSDYTTVSTDAYRETAYDLTVNANTDGDYTTVSSVWIDWNQNCVFEASEGYDLGVADNVPNGATANSPLSIMVPAGAVLGTTTMRVTTKYASGATACQNGHDAEVEDYSINVLSSLSIEEQVFSSFSIFPNPNNGEFTIKLNSASNNIGVKVYDMTGRSIFDNAYKNTGDFNQTISLTNVQSGVYLVSVVDGEKQVTKRIIVE